MTPLEPAEQREFEALLWQGWNARLSPYQESRLRHLLGRKNPGAQTLPLPQLVHAGMIAHGASLFLEALIGG
jgi:hypothetical protein